METHSWLTVTVSETLSEADDILVFELTLPGGGNLAPFSAGAHINVEIRPGLVRQYSLCNNPRERNRYVIAVLKEPSSRGGSSGMHSLRRGSKLRISLPRNHFALEPSATRSVLFAGGIGITPLLCMAEHLSDMGAEFDLHYCSRSPSRAGFRARIASSGFARRVHFHFDDGEPTQRLDVGTALGSPSHGVHAYVCGPSGFMEYVLNAAVAKGFREANLHREYFVANDVRPAGDTAFQVTLSSSGRVIDIPPEKTVLETLRDAGIALDSSCEQGVCGACLTGVIEGTPDHRDCFLTPEERMTGDRFAPCCSRAQTPMLVLDL